MTTIKASCPVCGDVELTADAVTVWVGLQGARSHFDFTCPECHDLVKSPADDWHTALLLWANAPARRIPGEVSEEHHGGPLTYDDYLDFCLDLAEIDLLAAVAGAEVAR